MSNMVAETSAVCLATHHLVRSVVDGQLGGDLGLSPGGFVSAVVFVSVDSPVWVALREELYS